MEYFTIRDIENLCGIKAHTLRIWEQRYRLCVARRKESLHRIYDNEDLKELLQISFLYHNGHKISQIACLSPEEIHDLVQKTAVQQNNHEVYVHQLLEAGIDFDKEKFEKTVNCLVLRIGMDKCITDVFFPFLHRIGMLWMTNKVIPAQEHFVSHIIRKKIIMAIDGLGTEQTGVPTILFTPAGEFHEIPLLAINYFFRKNQTPTTYFGMNVSLGSMMEYARNHPVSRFYAHIITHLDHCGMENYILELCRSFPDKEVIVSGPALRCTGHLPANLRVLRSREDILQFTSGQGRTPAI